MVDSFTILPAIDLHGGKVVRLTQGDPARQTTYADSPRHWAERWKDEGAEWLHVINLDGAFGLEFPLQHAGTRSHIWVLASRWNLAGVSATRHRSLPR